MDDAVDLAVPPVKTFLLVADVADGRARPFDEPFLGD
jgi:hypothetical protein